MLDALRMNLSWTKSQIPIDPCFIAMLTQFLQSIRCYTWCYWNDETWEILLCGFLKGSKWCCRYSEYVTLSRQETYCTLISLLSIQPETLLRLQNNVTNLRFGDWGASCLFMTPDSQIVRRGFCLREDGLFIHAVWLGSSESQHGGFQHALEGTHVWSPPPPLLFHPVTRLRRSHFHVWKECCPLMWHLQFTRCFSGVYM